MNNVYFIADQVVRRHSQLRHEPTRFQRSCLILSVGIFASVLGFLVGFSLGR